MKATITILSVLILSGCAMQPVEKYGPDKESAPDPETSEQTVETESGETITITVTVTVD